MKRRILQILIIVLPLGAIAQQSPITWHCKAVRVGTNHFEFHLSAEILMGWSLYKANRTDDCPFSPTITFDKRPKIEAVGDVDVIEGIECIKCDTTQCSIPAYRHRVIFVQLFEMSQKKEGIVSGEIHYRPVSKHMARNTYTYRFRVKVNSESHTK